MLYCMNKKRIILLSSLLGVAVALLGLLILIMARDDKAAAQPAPTEAPTAAPTAEPTATADPRLQLSSGPVARDVTELTLESVTEEDLEGIRELTDLVLLDGRACENGSLLRAFSETVSYPVLWSVALGDVRVDSDAKELTVPPSVTTAAEVLAALADLPQVDSVDLRESGLTNAETAALREAVPELTVQYAVNVQGMRDDPDLKVLSLDAAAIRDWDALAQEIGLLTSLERIEVAGALTPEQAAYLLEGAGSIPASYSISFKDRIIGSEDEAVDFSDLPASDLSAIKAALIVLPKVKKVNLNPRSGSSKWTLDEADQLQQLREGLLVDYTTKSFGVSFSLADEAVSFNGKNLKRRIEELKLLLPYLRNVKRVDMENCGIDNETMAALRDQFPQPKLVWRVKVGAYTVRTDARMIKFSAGGGKALHDKDTENLKYCRDVRYLDLGHNEFRHIDFVANMPELEVCIIAVGYMTSLEGIQNCPKLEYAEFLSGLITDVSPLAACTELVHLNLVYNRIKDMTPLYGLTKLERLWISRNDIPADQVARFKELVPDCQVNTTVQNPTRGGWRYFDEEFTQITPRYDLLRRQFRYDYTSLRSYGDGWWDDGKVHAGEQPPYDPNA